MSLIHELLKNFGSTNNLPCGVIRVDEDFNYMKGKNRANENSNHGSQQSWPSNSIFNIRDPRALPLNDMLSMAHRYNTKYLDEENKSVEKLKKVLFEDTFLSRRKFLNMKGIGRQSYFLKNEKDCCECEYKECQHEKDCCKSEYKECQHFDDVLYLSLDSKKYYKMTCPICVFQIGHSCNKFASCCIRKMKQRRSFHSLLEACEFSNYCYHFQYERSYIHFSIERNLFENA